MDRVAHLLVCEPVVGHDYEIKHREAAVRQLQLSRHLSQRMNVPPGEALQGLPSV